MKNPCVSVIVTSYNKIKYVNAVVDSVINQSYSSWELIIIDDCSTDGSQDLIINLSQADNRIKFFFNPQNKGANFSRNIGLSHSKGTLIIFLDADDLLSSSCLENRVNQMVKNNVDFCVFPMETFFKVTGDNKNIWLPASTNPLKDFFEHNLPWSILQPIWKKKVLVETGGFDCDMERLQDVEFHTRVLLKNKYTFKLIKSPVDCFYRIDETRKNYNVEVFLKKWVDSANRYYKKFYSEALNLGMSSNLLGTIFRTYLQLLYHFKNKELSKHSFEQLENHLFQQVEITKSKRYLFKIARIYNLFFIRIPGINWLLNKMIVS